MKVNREKLLGTLELVSPGLSIRESVQQSSCFVFQDGRVYTFNDEVACSAESHLPNLTGAVRAKPLLDLLSRLDEEEIDIERKENELLVKGKGRRASYRMESEVLLPIDAVEPPTEWMPVDKEFCEAINIVYTCAAAKEDFPLVCVHISPDFVEACDKLQIARYPIKIPIQKPGDGQSVLIRAESIAKIVSLAVTDISESPAWLHFRNVAGLVISCRRCIDSYPDLSLFADKSESVKITMPGGLQEIVTKAEIFSAEASIGNYVKVSIKGDVFSIKGDGPFGWYEERKKIAPVDVPLEFVVSPKMLLAISEKSNECSVVPGKRLIVDSTKFFYCTAITNPENMEPKRKTERSSSDQAE